MQEIVTCTSDGVMSTQCKVRYRLIYPAPSADEDAPDEFPGHTDSAEHLNDDHDAHDAADEHYMAEEPQSPTRVKVDKSNLLLLGPTGCGKTYILE